MIHNHTTSSIQKFDLDFNEMDKSLKLLINDMEPYVVDKVEVSASMIKYLVNDCSVEKIERDYPIIYCINIEENKELKYGDFKITYKLRNVNNSEQRYEEFKEMLFGILP